MTLVRRERDRGGGRVILVECPACGADLRGRDGADHFYTSHEPDSLDGEPGFEVALG